MRAEGTLIVVAPCNEGLVVASDTRQTIDDAVYCDGAEKLLLSARLPNVIIAVTGRRGFYPLSLATARDICAFIRETPREFDLGMVVKRYIDVHSDFDPASSPFDELAATCVQATTDYVRLNPWRHVAVSGDHFSSTVLIASYDPANSQSRVRTFSLSTSPDGRGFVARTGLDELYLPDDKAEPLAVGEFDYLANHVLPVIGNLPVGAHTRRCFEHHPKMDFLSVRDTTLQNAAEVAFDLIHSTAKMTETVPANSGIGGPVDMRLLGKGDHVEKIDYAPKE